MPFGQCRARVCAYQSTFWVPVPLEPKSQARSVCRSHSPRHFAAAMMLPAIEIYRASFRPSKHLSQPYVMLGINVAAADTDDEARLLATSGRESFASFRRGMPVQLPPPNREYEKDVVPFGAVPLEQMQLVAFVGAESTIAEGLQKFVDATKADELIATSQIYDPAARLRSLQIFASAGSALSGAN